MAVRAFISYAHDDADHVAAVWEFAKRLDGDGIDVRFDKFVVGPPPRGWPAWMEDEVGAADFILVVASRAYYESYAGRSAPAQRRGSRFEANLIRNTIYNNDPSPVADEEIDGHEVLRAVLDARERRDTHHPRCVPILSRRWGESYVVSALGGEQYYHITDDYDALRDYLKLTDRASKAPPDAEAGSAGRRDPEPALDRAHDPHGISPDEQLVEQGLADIIRRQVELFGYTRIATPVLLQGDSSAEVDEEDARSYVVHVPPGDAPDDASLTLPSDLTLSLTRYVAYHSELLAFPFRGYRMQSVFGPPTGSVVSGEDHRCDVDIIGARGRLDPLHDAEIAALIYSVFQALPGPRAVIHISNRSILRDLLTELGVPHAKQVLVRREIRSARFTPPDVLEAKLRGLMQRPEAVMELLATTDVPTAGKVLSEAGVTGGAGKLRRLFDNAKSLGVPADCLVLDFYVVRDYDYYTGTVFETYFDGYQWPSVCFGGRYDHLANDVPTGHWFPGVGVSFDLTGLFEFLLATGTVTPSRSTGADVLVVREGLTAGLGPYNEAATSLRAQGVKTELCLEPKDFAHHKEHARRTGVPVLVHGNESDVQARRWCVQNMRTGVEREVAAGDLVAYVADLLATMHEPVTGR